jgi:hypothetical protein
MAKELQVGSDDGLSDFPFTACNVQASLLLMLIDCSVFITDIWWMVLSPLFIPLVNVLPHSMRLPWLP